MTKKLYWIDPYQQKFKAEVIGINRKGITLNQTLFYPLSGNQLNDKGILVIGKSRIIIKEVSLEDDKIIHHISPESLNKIKIGDKVDGEINWEYRYGLMKAHTSQHIFSAIFKNKFKINTERANINFEDVSLHISEEISYSQLKSALECLNLICNKYNRNISAKLISAKDLESKSKEIRGDCPKKDPIRVIEIQDLDLVCCGGTHVNNSNEIGPVFLYEFKRGKEIKYCVGTRALEKISEFNTKILDMANFIEEPIETFNEKYKMKSDELVLVQNQNKDQLLQILNLSKAFPKEVINGISVYLLNYMIDHKLLKKSFSDYPENSLLLLLTDDKRLKIHSNSEKVNAELILKSLILKFGGKGGGNPKSAQGSLENTPVNLMKEINLILEEFNK
ncbi:MAG: alanine--tRNA ligase-related protein [Candidatus Hodarchaeota archaeon]